MRAAARTLRAAGALVAGVAMMVASVPAGASDSRVSFMNPPSPADGQFIEGPAQIKVRATSSLGLSTITISIEPQNGGSAPPGASAKYKALPVTNEEILTHEWDPSAPGSTNGLYAIVARSRSQIDDNLGSPWAVAVIKDVKVNLPPAAPQNVSAAMEGATPVVKWAASPEADVAGYRILRSTGGGFSPIGTVEGATLFKDASAPSGASISYQVVALRPTWDRSGVLESKATASGALGSGGSTPSPAVSTRVEVPSPAAAAPSPAAAPPAPKQLAILPKPPRVVAPPPYETSAKPGGFEEQLPYAGDPALLNGVSEDVIAANADDRDPAAVDQRQASTALTPVDKTRYAAAGLLLFVFALHVVRGARRLMRPTIAPFRTA